MPEARPGPWWRWLALSAVVAAADLATKAWVSAAFQVGDVHVITPFFNLVLWHNPGAAFSFLAGAGGWQRFFFAGVAAIASIVIVAMLRRHSHERLFSLGLALILGGALGNLIDRLTIESVVDFVLVHDYLPFRNAAIAWLDPFPAFNVADSAITGGAIALIIDSFRPRPATDPK